jgi:hypothetical protein
MGGLIRDEMVYSFTKSELEKIILDATKPIGNVSFLQDRLLNLYNELIMNPEKNREVILRNIKIITSAKEKMVAEHGDLFKLLNFDRRLEDIVNAEEKINTELKPKAIRAEKMTGQKLTQEDKKIFISILSVQRDLFMKHGGGHISSLTNAIKKYSRDNQLTWHFEVNEKIIKSKYASICYHKKRGNLSE